MKKIKIILIIAISFFTLLFLHVTVPRSIPDKLKTKAIEAFNNHLKIIKKPNHIILIDYSKDIFQRRLWLYDIKNDQILLNTRVSHALKSGYIYCKEISNTPNSHKSCAGSFITKNQYYGDFGNSMKIIGLEKENKNAFSRAIVFHNTNNYKYTTVLKNFSKTFNINEKKMIPSWIGIYSRGCFAFEKEELDPFIEKVKNGTFMYVGT